MAPDGTDQRDVPWSRTNIRPTWSPDGKRLAALDHDHDRLVIHEVATGEDTIVTTPADFGIAAWSPESDRLVLYGDPSSTHTAFGFYVVTVDGSGGLQRLGDGEDFGWMPASAQ